MRERPEDPWLSYCGHPELPAGFNSLVVNGDEVDGPGANEPVWPLLTDFYVGLKPVLNDPSDMDLFVSTCPDLVVQCENDTVVIPCEFERLPIRRRA